ncbi:GmrSD restriction endonuclease domain-containing protein [Actinomadura nitritigenes]|uniref:GmrSD restriction endonuclease domain-containing protein n=1 Tax=Actinomadura nitritigenes TaxID=134602 RepID=UPI003D8F38FB
MNFSRTKRRTAGAIATLGLTAGAIVVGQPPASARTLPEPSPATVARSELGDLTVAAPHPMTGYSREKFPHWTQLGRHCDTRETVLKRDGDNVVQDADCRAVSGTWHSAYDGRTLTSAKAVDVDHLVPLADAWRSGADAWTVARRTAFANDLVHPQLIAVSAASNRSKGDQSPDQWKPPVHAYWCTYSRAWIDVKHTYHLTVTEPERTALTQMLDNCT